MLWAYFVAWDWAQFGGFLFGPTVAAMHGYELIEARLQRRIRVRAAAMQAALRRRGLRLVLRDRRWPTNAKTRCFQVLYRRSEARLDENKWSVVDLEQAVRANATLGAAGTATSATQA